MAGKYYQLALSVSGIGEFIIRSYNRAEMIMRAIFAVIENGEKTSVTRNDGHKLGMPDMKRLTWKFDNGVFSLNGKTADVKNLPDVFSLILSHDEIELTIAADMMKMKNIEQVNENKLAEKFIRTFFSSEEKIEKFLTLGRPAVETAEKIIRKKKEKVQSVSIGETVADNSETTK